MIGGASIDEDGLVGIPKRATFAQFVSDMLEAAGGDSVEATAIVTRMLANDRNFELAFWDEVVSTAISATIAQIRDVG